MRLLNGVELLLVGSTEQLQRETESSGKKSRSVDVMGDLVSGFKMQLSIDKRENNTPRDSKPSQRIHVTWSSYTVTDLRKEI